MTRLVIAVLLDRFCFFVMCLNEDCRALFGLSFPLVTPSVYLPT